MADKDLSQRGKEVAYFVPAQGASFAFYGSVGHHLLFEKGKPKEITMPIDIDLCRSKPQLMETDAKGTPIGGEQKGEVPKPRSYSKTVPATPSPKVEGEKAQGEVVTTDKKKKGGKKTTEKKNDKKSAKTEEKKSSKKPKKPKEEEEEEEEDEGILGLDVDDDDDDDD